VNLVLTNKLKRQLLIVCILLLAFTLRIAAIDQIPPGLSHDEAYNGITALQVLEGQRAIFFEINKGIEPLIIYLEALAFYAFGIGPVPLRLVNIFFGLLTIALTYPFTARLFGRRIAIFALAGLAVSFWAIFVSRLALRAVLLPPFLLLTLYFLWRGLKPTANDQLSITNYQLPITPNLVFWVLSGVAAGITMYTYLASRFVPLIVVAIFSYLTLCRQTGRRHWLGLLLHFFIWAVLFAPLAHYFLEHAESFSRRADQVSTIPYALEGDFGPITRHTLRTLGMFTLRGDTTDRYNLDGRPVFDWGNGLLFYLGVGSTLWQIFGSPRKAGAVVYLVLIAFFMLLPNFITDDSPHFLRTIGALPVTYIFWALGLNLAIPYLNKCQNSINTLLTTRRPLPPTPYTPGTTHYTLRFTFYVSYLLHPSTLIFLLFLFTTLHTGYDYFYRWVNAPNARYIYGADIAKIADDLKTSTNSGLPAISAEYYRDLDPFRFKLHFQGRPPFVIWFDGRQTLAFPPAGSNLSPRYLFPASAPAAQAWNSFLEISPAESSQDYSLYHLPEISPLEQLRQRLKPIGVNINDDLIILGYQILGELTSGEKFQLLLSWQALRTLPPDADYTFLVQLYDEQGQLRAETDGNGYSPGDWQPGVSGLQLLTLRLPRDVSPDRFRLTLQVVDRRRGQALPAMNRETNIELSPVTLAEK
jgi:4-amino-4-deoxy-L-arabinose transferase-like glycosyltransferase